MSDRSTIDKPAAFLAENGILFEINRQVLHPLGLELHLRFDETGDFAGLELEDNRAAADPIFFSPADFEAGRSKYEAYMEAAGRRNVQKRRRMGMVIQTGSNVRPHMQDGP